MPQTAWSMCGANQAALPSGFCAPEENDAVTDEGGGLRVHVDSETFDIRQDPDQPGGCHYLWVSGPNPGYGFTQVRSDGLQASLKEHRAAIRDFLSSINPESGYLD